MRVSAVGDYELLGTTLDDAAGEAFDKTAKLLGLEYPGGPALAALADGGTAGRVRLPRPLLHSGTLDFSFAGLKTAVLTAVTSAGGALDERGRAELAAEFQQAVVEVLVAKSLAALHRTGLERLVIAGGVGANRALRAALAAAAARNRVKVHFPELQWCTDNGAMIALAGALRLRHAARPEGYSFVVNPRWPLQPSD